MLISQLHDQFGDNETIAQQAKLIQEMEFHLHQWDEPEPTEPNLADTEKLLFLELD